MTVPDSAYDTGILDALAVLDDAQETARCLGQTALNSSELSDESISRARRVLFDAIDRYAASLTTR